MDLSLLIQFVLAVLVVGLWQQIDTVLRTRDTEQERRRGRGGV